MGQLLIKPIIKSFSEVYLFLGELVVLLTRAKFLLGNLLLHLSGYHADTPITIKAEPFIWPTAALINIHEHPI